METKNPQPQGLRASMSIGGDRKPDSTQPVRRAKLSAFLDPRHTVTIRRLGGLFEVRVEPEHPAHQPATFASWQAARGYAGGLRLINRWAVSDEVLEAHRG